MSCRPSAALCLIFFLASQLTAQTQRTAIMGINVVDVVRGEIHPGQTVVIANGVIEAAGPSGGVAIPADGKVADLLILRSNPLEAIRHTQEIDTVFKAGKRYSRSDLEAMLRQVEEKVAASRRKTL